MVRCGPWQAGIESSILATTIPWCTRYISGGVDKSVATGAAQGTERMKRRNLRKDLFYYLNNDNGAEPVSPPLSTVIAEAILVTVAGLDTTSVTLCNILYLLMRHPDAYQRLQKEVDKFYPSGENALDCKFHPEMIFLGAMITEALRLYPVIPSGSQRATQGKGTTTDS